jgi:hypothetical protein
MILKYNSTDALATYMERLGLPEGQATPVGDWRATIDIFVKEAYVTLD